jgi:DNA polymerase-3 subunit delta'
VYISDMGIFGYEHLLQDFKKLAETGALSHAYLFHGEPEIGKFLFAQTLAEHLAHPSDIHVIDFLSEEGNPSTNSGQESAGIEKVRELGHFLYQTSSVSETESRKNHKIAIIRDAQWLTDQAQNALLKILEEPPKAGMILATATDPDIFLPAVRSRFQLIFMPVLPQAQILDFLDSYDIMDTRKNDIAKQAHGRIGRAKKLVPLEKSRPEAPEAVSKTGRSLTGLAETPEKSRMDAGSPRRKRD